MEAPEVDRLARRYVPGAGPVHISRVGKGLCSATYRVERDGAAYALRVAPALERGEGFDPRWEFAVRELAGKFGVGPAVERTDPAAGILVSRWVEGDSWASVAAADPAAIAAIVALMRAIHALPPPRPVRAIGVADWIDHYERAVGDAPTLVARDLGALRAAAARRLGTRAAAGAAAPVLCHGDLHRLNLVETPTALVALDWEYAHLTDPLWDVAGWSCANDLAEPARRELLERYLGRGPTARERVRLLELAWLYDYIGLLWSELYLRQADAAGDAEARARAAGIAARL